LAREDDLASLAPPGRDIRTRCGRQIRCREDASGCVMRTSTWRRRNAAVIRGSIAPGHAPRWFRCSWQARRLSSTVAMVTTNADAHGDARFHVIAGRISIPVRRGRRIGITIGRRDDAACQRRRQRANSEQSDHDVPPVRNSSDRQEGLFEPSGDCLLPVCERRLPDWRLLRRPVP
jgi:hypothetical protein